MKARTDVEALHKRIHSDVSHKPASNSRSDIAVSSSYSQSTGRTRNEGTHPTPAKASARGVDGGGGKMGRGC